VLEEILSFWINGLESLESLLLRDGGRNSKTLTICRAWDLIATAGNKLLRKTTGFSVALG